MDIREHSPVGTKKPDTKQGLQPGYEAQGFALAQSIIGQSISTARDMQRIALKCFELSQAAREEMMKVLRKWKRDCTEAAKANGNLQDLGTRALGKLAGSATTRVAEFNAIVKAMDMGMTMTTVANTAGVEDPEEIGFHTFVAIARQFQGTQASNAGRKPDPFPVKLQKWLDKQEDSDDKEAVVAVLTQKHLLPEPVAVSATKS